MVNVYYNYFKASDPGRAEEIDSCFAMLAANKEIGRLCVLHHGNMPAVHDPGIRDIQCNERPSFREFFGAVQAFSSDDDVNAILNSDCCLDEENALQLQTIRHPEAFCLSRCEVKSLVPLKIDKNRNRHLIRKRLMDSQDCWVIRGKPPTNMWLDFAMGVPGCDNRLCHELQKAGYVLINPISRVRVFHYHRSPVRGHSPANRVPPPYAFPRCC